MTIIDDNKENNFFGGNKMTIVREQLKTCNVNEAKEILSLHLNAIWKNSEMANKLPPMMIWGPPGIGKSTLVKSVAEEEGIGFIDVRLAQREPVDIRGLPVPREDRQGIDWIVASEWPREGVEGTPERGIILFDELTAADATLQVAAYEFILDRRLGELYSVPSGWYIVAAGNRSTDNAVARTMSSALANRFMHLDLGTSPNEWCEWAAENKHHPDVIGFIKFRPDLLLDMSTHHERGWPSPRSWSRISEELYLAEKIGMSERMVGIIVDGLVGIGAGLEFQGFRRAKMRLPDIKAMLKGPIDEIKFPKDADQRWAVITSIVPHLLDEGIPKKMLDGVMELVKQMEPSWVEFLIMDVRKRGNKPKPEHKDCPDEGCEVCTDWEKTNLLIRFRGHDLYSERIGKKLVRRKSASNSTKEVHA